MHNPRPIPTQRATASSRKGNPHTGHPAGYTSGHIDPHDPAHTNHHTQTEDWQENLICPPIHPPRTPHTSNPTTTKSTPTTHTNHGKTLQNSPKQSQPPSKESSHTPARDTTHIQPDNDKINSDNPYEPWKNITKLTKTVTTSIKGIQETLYKENKDRKNLLKEEDIAITLQNKQIMETFCTEPVLVRGFNITFSPKKKKNPQEKNSLKYQLFKHSGRNTRRTTSRISLTICKHSWNPPTHT